jgi:hypothetical protein
MNSVAITAIALCAALLNTSAFAKPVDNPAYAPCVARAAQAFNIPELPLWVILDVERGTVG